MPTIIIPKKREELEKQITSLKYLIKHDKEEKDRLIHIKALEDTMRALEVLNNELWNKKN